MRSFVLLSLLLPWAALAQAPLSTQNLGEVKVRGLHSKNGLGNLPDVGGAVIYAGKKTEVLVLDSLDANTASTTRARFWGAFRA